MDKSFWITTCWATVIVFVASIVVGVVVVGYQYDDFKTSYGVSPYTDTDGQKAVVQTDVTRTILALAADDEDARAIKCDSPILNAVQSCTKDKVEGLKAADAAFKKAANSANHFGYDIDFTADEMTAYRTAQASSKVH